LLYDQQNDYAYYDAPIFQADVLAILNLNRLSGFQYPGVFSSKLMSLFPVYIKRANEYLV